LCSLCSEDAEDLIQDLERSLAVAARAK